MKICTLFLVALTAFVFIAPANGQRRKRETQPQPKTEQTTPSGNGRRTKNQAAQTPSVPCTIPLADSPTLQRIKLNYAPNQLEYALGNNTYFDQAPGNQDADGFIYSFVFYPRATPRPSLAERMTPQQTAELDNYLRQVKPQEYEKLQKAREAQRNAPQKAQVVTPNQIVKKMSVAFYGRDIPRIYNIQIQYSDEFVFENEEAIKQNLAENLKIPAGSWVSIPDPDYNQKVLFSAFSLLNLQLVPVENLILRQANCNGWRAVFVTSADATGLLLSITNSSVSDNMEQLIAQDKKATNDAKKKRTNTIFKPN